MNDLLIVLRNHSTISSIWINTRYSDEAVNGICLDIIFNFAITRSVAREPDLKEWTARTKIYDKLHDPVGF